MKRDERRALALVAAVVVVAVLCLPRNLFKDAEYSSVVTSRDGELLGARIAADGQWRFPPSEAVPDKYAKALIQFEDRRFRWHNGVDPLAIGRALWQNVSAGRTVSGGSTISMQVIRLSRGKKRNIWQKAIEAVLATRLEARYSKKQILALYASHAPFGGNVVGLQAASWRYFGRSAEDLTWAEAATLAVLPNSPSSIHVGKNREQLLEKRNRLLERLYTKGYMSSEDYELACDEPLPGEPLPLPQYAFHYVDRCSAENPGKETHTSIDLALQKRVEQVTDRWCAELSQTGVADLAAVVIDVHTGEVLAWCGNSDLGRKRSGAQVDVARAPRSTGSILKPFLYCAALRDGVILPNTLLKDTPVNINGFSPQNFDLHYSGAVPASEALCRSLNVPFVHLLKEFGVPKFHGVLKDLGFSTFTRPADDYGLSLILGGGEGRLDEITSAFAAMSAYYQGLDRCEGFPLWDKTAIWYSLEALKDVNRPDEIDWRYVSSARMVAWKTGTSYGFRDAWAVGVTPDYAVGVWAGNASGEGVPGLVGARTSGPVLFDIFNVLPASGWFSEPEDDESVVAEVCPQSGHLRGPNCDDAVLMALPQAALRSAPCPYHKMVGGVSMFLLPPSMEWYYRQHHPEYQPAAAASEPMEFIYPEPGSVITIPRQNDGTQKGIVFNLAHSNPSQKIYWHLDSEYVATTEDIHQLTLSPSLGRHNVTVVDSSGSTLSISFTISQ